jgi:hypothetical protein
MHSDADLTLSALISPSAWPWWTRYLGLLGISVLVVVLVASVLLRR